MKHTSHAHMDHPIPQTWEELEAMLAADVEGK